MMVVNYLYSYSFALVFAAVFFSSNKSLAASTNRARSTTDLFNLVSNYPASNVGNNIVQSDNTILVSKGIFMCNDDGSNCAASHTMFALLDISGTIDCIDHVDVCNLHGNGVFCMFLVRVMVV